MASCKGITYDHSSINWQTNVADAQQAVVTPATAPDASRPWTRGPLPVPTLLWPPCVDWLSPHPPHRQPDRSARRRCRRRSTWTRPGVCGCGPLGLCLVRDRRRRPRRSPSAAAELVTTPRPRVRAERQGRAAWCVLATPSASASAAPPSTPASRKSQVAQIGSAPDAATHSLLDREAAIERTGASSARRAELVWRSSPASRSPLYPLWEIDADRRLHRPCNRVVAASRVCRRLRSSRPAADPPDPELLSDPRDPVEPGSP